LCLPWFTVRLEPTSTRYAIIPSNPSGHIQVLRDCIFIQLYIINLVHLSTGVWAQVNTIP
jgi:hypothetical protein